MCTSHQKLIDTLFFELLVILHFSLFPPLLPSSKLQTSGVPPAAAIIPIISMSAWHFIGPFFGATELLLLLLALALAFFKRGLFPWSLPVAPAGQHPAAQGLPRLARHLGQPARHQRHGGRHPRVADGRGAGGSPALHHQLRARGAALSRHQQVPGEVPNSVVPSTPRHPVAPPSQRASKPDAIPPSWPASESRARTFFFFSLLVPSPHLG